MDHEKLPGAAPVRVDEDWNEHDNILYALGGSSEELDFAYESGLEALPTSDLVGRTLLSALAGNDLQRVIRMDVHFREWLRPLKQPARISGSRTTTMPRFNRQAPNVMSRFYRIAILNFKSENG
ncbi:MAG: hypothetical protein WBO17_01660 [Sphingorhabdus sp.]